ncbi:MAG: NAD(P)H-dependent oxidoreductase [Firmicutes bacterium]|nr:NAD(P)H-dependent oxidoreductase [Bacillota bacterium]
MKTLLINACVRKESRTKRITNYLLNKTGASVQEISVCEQEYPLVDQDFLNMRDALIAHGKFDAPCFQLARQFADADNIVIAAPYWDLSFPSVLKNYFEQINVVGLTFRYSSEGVPVGLVKAKSLYYITTAGGNFVPLEYGYGYVKALAQSFYQIPNVKLIIAKGLDIRGADAENIIKQTEKQIDRLFEHK